MESNVESKDDIKEYLQFLKKIRCEVENWPDYKKVDGYVAHRWTLGKVSHPDKTKDVENDIRPWTEISP